VGVRGSIPGKFFKMFGQNTAFWFILGKKMSAITDCQCQCQCQCQSWIYIAHKRKASNALGQEI